ncbi:MAG: DsrE family protein [Nitrososphaerota archaeon]|nr:DsrE family protein [Nitrososphaerota archaeon]
MAKSLAIAITKAPFGTIHAAEAIRLANGAISYGHEVTVVLIGDGIYMAKTGQKAEEAGWTSLSPLLEKLVSSGRAKVLVDSGSAVERGVRAEDLVAGAAVSEGRSISLAMADADRCVVF